MNFEHWQNSELPPLGNGTSGGSLEYWQNGELAPIGVGSLGVATVSEQVTQTGAYVEIASQGRATLVGAYVELISGERVTLAGAYVEITSSERVTQAGAYVEIGGATVGVTLAGSYVEINIAQDRVTQVGAYVEIGPDMRVTQAGAYIEIGIPARPKPAVHRRPHFYASIQQIQSFTPDYLGYNTHPMQFAPKRWSWMRPGGCNQAEVEVMGRRRDIWHALPATLGQPIFIYNNNHSKCWWGYVHAAELYTDELTLGISLDSLYNYVAVSYTQLNSGDTTGTPTTTSWVQDDDSLQRWGRKELLQSYGDATATAAESLRDDYLEKFRYITPDVRTGGSVTLGGKLICKGWWHRMGWRYYANEGTDEVLISDQISDMVAAMNDIFKPIDITLPHSIETNEYRDGTQTIQQIVESLMQIAEAPGQRFTGYITPERFFRFGREEVSGRTDWLLMPDNQFRTFLNGIPDPGTEIIGWTQLRGMLPTANWGYMISPTPLYIEENEFDADTLRYNWRARGALSPWG